MAVSGRLRWALALAIPLVLTGCITIGGGGKPLPSLMTLTPSAEAPAGQTLSTPNARVVAVLAPEVDHSLATTRVPVQVSPNAVAYLTGGAWVEMPAHLFQNLMVEVIRARGRVIVVDRDQPQTAIRLDGRLSAMGYDAQTHSVIVRFDAERVGAERMTTTRRFEAVEKDIGPTAAEIAPALNLAANDVAVQVADWVGQ